MIILLQIFGLAILFLGAMQEIGKKSWSYIGKSLMILVAFLAYAGLGIWILFVRGWDLPHTSAVAGVLVFSFLLWLMVGVVGMVLASPKE